MIYKFPNIKNESHIRGYAAVIIFNGEANIDQTNNLQIALAENLGGTPHTTMKPQVVTRKKQLVQKKGSLNNA